MTIKEKAKEYLMNFPANSTFSIEEMIVNAFVAGAESCKPQWKDGSDTLTLADGAQYIVKKDKKNIGTKFALGMKHTNVGTTKKETM